VYFRSMGQIVARKALAPRRMCSVCRASVLLDFRFHPKFDLRTKSRTLVLPLFDPHRPFHPSFWPVGT
jgi:hypothetical protein